MNFPSRVRRLLARMLLVGTCWIGRGYGSDSNGCRLSGENCRNFTATLDQSKQTFSGLFTQTNSFLGPTWGLLR